MILEKITQRRNFVLGIFALLTIIITFSPSFALAAAGKAITNVSPGVTAEFDIDGDLTCGQGLFTVDKDDWAPKLGVPTTCPSGTQSIFAGTGAKEPPPATGPPNIAAARFQDVVKKNTDTVYGQGSKQNDTDTWVEVLSSSPPKADIGNVYSAARLGFLKPLPLPSGWVAAPSTNVIAFMGFERISANGDTHLDYELNQAPFRINAKGASVPQRCSVKDQMIGTFKCLGHDLLIGVDDGTSKIPTITAYKWVGTNNSTTVGSFVPVTTSTSNPFTFSLGETNRTAAIHPGPWGTFNSQGTLVFGTSNKIAIDKFSEVSIDLTVVTGLAIGCPGQFKTILIKSRSSSEVNSELKDRVTPTAFGLDTCGIIKITKRNASDPKNITLLPGAVFTITPDPATGTGFITVTSDANGIVYNSSQVKPGIYTIHEVSSPLGNVPVADQICDVSAFKATCTLVIDNVGLQHLTAIKSANPPSDSNVVSGQIITYTIAYKNDGTAPALNSIITDTVDANLTSIVPQNGGILTGNTIKWSLGSVGINATGTVSFTAKVIVPKANVTILNKAHVINDRDLAGFDTNVTMHHVGPPNLTLNKAVDKKVASPGDTLLYTLNYANIGQGDATGVVITDKLPAKTTFVSATGGGVYTNGTTTTVSWNIGTLLHGVSGSVTFTVKLDAVFPSGTTTVTNFGNIISSTTPLTPSNPVMTDVSAKPILKITKAVDKTTAVPGDTLVYTLNFSNTGNANASGVVISDKLPAKTTFVSATGGGIYTNSTTTTVTWNIGAFAAGATSSVSFTVKLDAVFPNGTTTVTNSAVMASAELPTVPSNPVTTNVTAKPILNITKAVDKTTALPGDTLVYTLNFSNTGNADASGVVISDKLPAKTTFVSATGGGIYTNSTINTVSWNIGAVAAGATSSVSFTVKLDAVFPNGTTPVTNSAVMASAELPTVPSNPVTTNVTAKPILNITKAVDKTTALPGDTLVYTLNFSNTGNADASGVVISDKLPAKTTFVSASAPGVYTNSTVNTVSWNIGAVAAGATGFVTFTVKLDAVFPNGTTTVTNSAVMASAELPTVPSNPVTTDVTAAPIMKITKAVDKTTAMPGDTLVYTLHFSNTGNANASGVVISDKLPAKTTFVSASAPGVYTNSAINTVSWNIGAVAAGATSFVTFTVKLDAVFPSGITPVTN
ncbi:MAG: SpaA isopeptide-forming pilin-related protein, partial [Nitrospirota bacterium]